MTKWLSACAIAVLPLLAQAQDPEARIAELEQHIEFLTSAMKRQEELIDFLIKRNDELYASLPRRKREELAARREAEAKQPSASFGQHVIPANECIGAVVSGVCHGTPTPGEQIRIETGQTPKCYGQMIGGRCAGAMF